MRELTRRIPIRGRGYSVAYQACGPLACNVYALICEMTKDAIIIDPSPHNPDEFNNLRTYLEEKECTPKHILLTHGHADHIVGVKETMKLWPNVSLHLHPLEIENYTNAKEMGSKFGIIIRDGPLPTPTDTLNDGDIIRVGNNIALKVVDTPGHSPGHVAFVDDNGGDNNIIMKSNKSNNRRNNKFQSKNVDNNVENEIIQQRNDAEKKTDGDVIFSGDLLFRGSVGRTDFPNSSSGDLLRSLQRLYEEYDDKSIVLSGHTTPTFLRQERKTNPHVISALLLQQKRQQLERVL